MTEIEPGSGEDDTVAALRVRTEILERQLMEAETRSALQMRQAELKAEALRVGIIDMDGLRLLEADVWTGEGPSQNEGAPDVIARLRRDKPWLFGASHSSSPATAPAASVTRRRLATDMSLEEWRAARADLLRRR